MVILIWRRLWNSWKNGIYQAMKMRNFEYDATAGQIQMVKG